MRFVHTCVRVRDPEASLRFYEALGFERRGRLNFETAYNIYLGLPGDGDTLELTVNRGREEPYDVGDGYNHMALVVEDLDATLATLAAEGSSPRSRRTPRAAGPRLAGSRLSPTPTVTASSSSTATSRRPGTPTNRLRARRRTIWRFGGVRTRLTPSRPSGAADKPD